MEQEKLYVIEEKTYEAHIDEEVHLYGLLHQLAFLAGKIKDREDVEAFIAAAKRYGQIADDKFDAWNIPGRYLVFGDKADLAGMKARELCELDAFYVECEDDEPEPGSGRQEEHYLIPGSGFRLLGSAAGHQIVFLLAAAAGERTAHVPGDLVQHRQVSVAGAEREGFSPPAKEIREL